MKIAYEPAHFSGEPMVNGLTYISVECPMSGCHREWIAVCSREGIEHLIAYHESCDAEHHAVPPDFRDAVATCLEEEASYCEHEAEGCSYWGRSFHEWRARRRIDMAKAVREQRW